MDRIPIRSFAAEGWDSATVESLPLRLFHALSAIRNRAQTAALPGVFDCALATIPDYGPSHRRSQSHPL
jgi:hypothetical protein